MRWRRCMAMPVVLALVAGVLAACGPGDHTEGGGTPGPGPVGATLSLFAGSLKRAGSEDGTGEAAALRQPQGVALDAAGNAYVADTGNHTIRRITPAGAVSTVAGAAGQAGSADGTGTAARFSAPQGVVVDAGGSLYVADTGNLTIRKITPAGVVTTLAGAAGQSGSADGLGASARFTAPTDLAVDALGNLYVADANTVRKIAPGGMVSTFAGVAGQGGQVGGDGPQARFNRVTGVAVDGGGNVYVSEQGTLRRFDGSARSVPLGTATDGLLAIPFAEGLAADAAGNAYLAAGGTLPIAPSFSPVFNSILRVTPQGAVTRIAGVDNEPGATDGPGASARFQSPKAIAVGANGRLVVADADNQAIRQIDGQNLVSTLAGGSGAGRVDGPGAQARFFGPFGLAATADGGLYVADARNRQIRRISPAGVVSTVQVTDENGSALVSFGNASEIAVNPLGGFYVAELPGRFDSPVWFVEASGRARRVPNVGSDAIATDRAGNLYAASPTEIVVVTPQGSRRVFKSGFTAVQAIVVSDAGVVHVADAGDATIRSFDASGNAIRTVGIAGRTGYRDGAGDQALFEAPTALALGAQGSLYVADNSNTIRKVDPAGVVSTVAGVAGQAGAKPGPALAPLGRVIGLAWVAGSLYATVDNAVIRISPLD